MWQRARLIGMGSALVVLIGAISLAGAAHQSAPSGEGGTTGEAAAESGQHSLPVGGISRRGKLAPLVRAARQRAALPVLGLNQWTSMGPNPATGRSTVPGYTVSGRVNALAYDKKKNHLYLASSGGVWGRYLSNSSFGWVALTDDQPSFAISSLAVDPSRGDVVYAGTGEAAEENRLGGVGVYKSADGGLTWQLYGSNLFQGRTVTALAVDPTDSSIVYAGVSNSLSGYGGSGGGVARSTDAGKTWAMVTKGGSSVSDLKVDALGDVYVALSQKAKASRVYVCLKPPHGGCGTFTAASNGLPGATAGVVKIALGPNTAGADPSSQILYAVISDASGVAANTDQLLGVYRSANGGHDWTRVAGRASLHPDPPSAQAHYDLTIAVDPSDATGNTVYAGMVDLFKTTNASSPTSSWTRLTAGSASIANGIHVDQHALLFVAGTLYAGNDGGVYTTTNGGAVFSSYNQNLGLTQFYGGAVGTTNTQLSVGGTQDNGEMMATGSTWSELFGGDEFYSAIDPTDNDIAFGESPYAHTKTFVLNRMDTTDTFNGNSDGARPNAPLIMDPDNSAKLFSGRQHVWVSTDNGTTWTQNPGPVTAGITALAAPANPDGRLYITDTSGKVWRQDGATVTALPSPGILPGRWITSLATDPANSQIVYATANGVNGAKVGHVLRSDDGGTTWKDISTSLPDMPFYSIVVSPLTPGTIYAGAELGVFVSRDSGATWYQLGRGLPNIRVSQLALNPGGTELTAFTFGRGAWRYALAEGIPMSWGINDTGQLGDGTTQNLNDCGRQGQPPCHAAAPADIPNLAGVTALAAGHADSFALRRDGTLLAWGANFDGQLGIGAVSNDPTTCECVPTPTPVVGADGKPITGIVAISAGSINTVALRNDGTVWAWGANYAGELGNGSVSTSPTPFASQVPGVSGIVAVQTFDENVVALKGDGTMIAWGANNVGQLGTGTESPFDPNHGKCGCIPSPVAVTGLKDVVSFAEGDAFTLALKADGTVWGWGWDHVCQLANVPEPCDPTKFRNSEYGVPTPTQITELSNVTQVAAGDRQGFALKKNGTVLGWGVNDYGQLGRGTVDTWQNGTPYHCACEGTPAPVIGGQDAVALAAGEGATIALQRDGSIMFWGKWYNDSAAPDPTPSTVPGVNLVRAVWAGSEHFLAIR